jgi:hypothetical protein
MEPATIPSTHDPKSDACATCAYLLYGLGEQGRCPECGTEYGPTRIVLWSHIPKSYRHFTSIVMTLGLLMVSLSLLAMCLVPQVDTVLVAAYYLAGGAAAAGGGWYMRNGWHVRLSRDGYGHRMGFGKARLTPWQGEETIILRRLDPATYLLAVQRQNTCLLSIRAALTDPQAIALRDRLAQATTLQVLLETTPTNPQNPKP